MGGTGSTHVKEKGAYVVQVGGSVVGQLRRPRRGWKGNTKSGFG
jgi:hypothetical protein